MTEEKSDGEKQLLLRKREHMQVFFERFRDAFDELHATVVSGANAPGKYLGPHYDYPIRSSLDSGFPSFQQAGSYEPSSPRNYVGSVRPVGLASLLLGNFGQEQAELPKGSALSSFLGGSLFADRLRSEDSSPSWLVGLMVSGAVERYYTATDSMRQLIRRKGTVFFGR